MTAAATRSDPNRSVRLFRTARRGGSAVADQLFSSGTQLLLLIAVAHRSSPSIFGAVSLVVIVHGFFLGSVRALVGDVTLIRCRAVGADPHDEAGRGLSLAVAFGLVSGALVAVVGMSSGGSQGHYLVLFALLFPVVHSQDLLRSVAYGVRRVGDAMVLDGVWLVVQVVASAALFFTGQATATSLVLAWGAGAACSFLLGWAILRYRVSPRGIRAWLRTNGSRGLGFLGDFAVSTGVVQFSFLMLGGVIFSQSQFGTFRLAFVAVSPLANLMGGLRSLNLARLADARGDRSTAMHKARRIGLLFIGIAGTYGAVVTLVPVSIGEIAFGDTWSSARGLVGAVALGEVFRLGGFPAIDFVKVYGSPGLLVRTRTLSSCLLVVAILAGGLLGGPRGAVWATAVALLFATGIWWRCAATCPTSPSEAAA